jgi:hypothetical protein
MRRFTPEYFKLRDHGCDRLNLQIFRLHQQKTAASIFYIKGAVDTYRGADKSLARPGRKEATATEDFDVHISYL